MGDALLSPLVQNPPTGIAVEAGSKRGAEMELPCRLQVRCIPVGGWSKTVGHGSGTRCSAYRHPPSLVLRRVRYVKYGQS